MRRLLYGDGSRCRIEREGCRELGLGLGWASVSYEIDAEEVTERRTS